MFIEQPPWFYRALYPGVTWRVPAASGEVFLTFDDGPIPEVTPWVLDQLDHYGVRATFFMVGDNVRKHPELFREVLARGHRVGNHTFNHIQGIHYDADAYMANVLKADEWIRALKRRFRIVMWDVVTRDYNRSLSPERVFDNVRRYTRDGSVIVFHDSLKAERNLRWALPRAIEWLQAKGYRFGTL